MRSVLLASASAAAFLVLAAFGCATSASSGRNVEPAPSSSPQPLEWQSPLHRDHPLVGRVWDVQREEWITLEQLEAHARAAHWVLLGETHDNADHHLLQARLLGAVVQEGRRPALAFEMLDVSQQPAVDAAVDAAVEEGAKPDAVAEAVAWDGSGWPAFSMYRPIFEVAMRARLPLVAANVPRDRLRAAMKEGLQSVDAPLRSRLEEEPPMPEALLAELADEMRVAHCGHLPEAMMPMFVLAQRLRDAQMALRMLEADEGAGAVLIAGSGHVRVDRGVPVFLRGGGHTRASISFVEVRDGADAPSDYVRDRSFDYVLFTPAAERPDPCEALRSHGRDRGSETTPSQR